MSEVKAKDKKKFDFGSLGKFAPIIGLVLVIVAFTILTDGKLLSTINLQNMANQVIVTALVAIGAVFVYGVGNFDMSLGSGVVLSAVLGAMAAIKTGNLLVCFLVCLAFLYCLRLSREYSLHTLKFRSLYLQLCFLQ